MIAIAFSLAMSVAVSLASAAPCAAPCADEQLPAAVDAYRAGNYAEAVERFARLAQAESDPGRAGLLHCNAGTAAARAERYGEAVWQLRRARMLAPRDAVARINLERVEALRGAIGGGAHSFEGTLFELPLRQTLDEIATLCSAVAGLALLLLAAWRAGRAPRPVLWTALLLLVCSGAWWVLGSVAWEREGRGAVVIPEKVGGRAEPDDASRILFFLPAGSLVSDEEQRGDWRLVQSDAGARGWVPAEQVRPLH